MITSFPFPEDTVTDSANELSRSKCDSDQHANTTARGNWLTRHFARYDTRGPWAYCWRITVEGVAISMLVGIAMSPMNKSPRSFLSIPLAAALILILVAAPILETLLFQALPIGIARLLRAKRSVQITISTAMFAAVHFPEGAPTGISAGLIGGFYLAFCFTAWLPRSFWTALWTTTISHGIRNLFAIVIIVVIAGGWPGSKIKALDFTGGGGGWVGLSAWYFWDEHHQFAFAILGDGSERRSLISGVLGDQIRGPFKLQLGEKYRDVSYDLESHLLIIDGRSFDLRQVNAIYVAASDNGLSYDARLLPVVPELFQQDQHTYFSALLSTTFFDYAPQKTIEYARKALDDYRPPQKSDNLPVSGPMPADSDWDFDEPNIKAGNN